MTDDDQDLRAVRGSNTLGPRWHEFRELNNTGAELIDAGKLARARAKLTAAYRLTLVDDVDDAGLDARARALANLSGLAEIQGRLDEALDLAAQSLRWCEAVVESVGNRYGTLDVLVSVLINRAQTLQVSGRVDEALTDIDTVLARFGELTADNQVILTFSLRNTKATTLMAARRWEEAETEARLALEWAWEHAPDLAGHPYGNLAAIKQATGDVEAAAEYLSLASESHAADGTRCDRALAIANRGRMALMGGDPATALRLFLAAEQEFTAAEDWWKLAETKYSRSVTALSVGDVDQARKLLAEVETILAPAGNSVALAECRVIAADVAGASGDFEAAQAGYDAAQRIYQEMNAGVDLARLDVRRGVSRYVYAQRLTDPDEQRRVLREVEALAVPAALAVDALRHRFSSGPDRERWVSMVAGPAMAMAFTVAAALDELPLIVDLLENYAATVSLHGAPERPTGVDPGQVILRQAMHSIQIGNAATILPPMDAEAVPFAAAAIPGADDPAPGFDRPRLGLPPRLRTDPSRRSVLDDWIEFAERRYGLPIRSTEVVRSW